MANSNRRVGRGRYNSQNATLKRKSSVAGMDARLAARVAGFEKLSGVPGEFTKPGSRNVGK